MKKTRLASFFILLAVLLGACSNPTAPSAPGNQGGSSNTEITGISVIPGDSTLLISWNDPSYEEFDHIRLSASPAEGSLSSAQTVLPGIEQYTADSLSNDTEYTIILTAYDKAGNQISEKTTAGIPTRELLFSGGEGTSTSPFLIYDEDDLAYLTDTVKSGTTYENHYFQLTQDITITSGSWQSIGGRFSTYPYEDNPFSGFFTVMAIQSAESP